MLGEWLGAGPGPCSPPKTSLYPDEGGFGCWLGPDPPPKAHPALVGGSVGIESVLSPKASFCPGVALSELWSPLRPHPAQSVGALWFSSEKARLGWQDHEGKCDLVVWGSGVYVMLLGCLVWRMSPAARGMC